MKIASKILSIVSSVLVFLVVLLAFALVGVRIFGIQVYTVLSGSMEPTYPTGSIIYVKKAEDTSALQKGDVITFRISENKTATHRIVEVLDDGGLVKYRTKGDNNPAADENPVLHTQVIGKAIFGIPVLGYVTAWIQSPPGLYYAIGAGVLLITLVVISDVLAKMTSNSSGSSGGKRGKKPETETKLPTPELPTPEE